MFYFVMENGDEILNTFSFDLGQIDRARFFIKAPFLLVLENMVQLKSATRQL